MPKKIACEQHPEEDRNCHGCDVVLCDNWKPAMPIADVSREMSILKELGYQWEEQIYNDGLNECSLNIAKAKSPTYFLDHPGGEAGWGRYGRKYCWVAAVNWVRKKEQGLDQGRQVP